MTKWFSKNVIYTLYTRLYKKKKSSVIKAQDVMICTFHCSQHGIIYAGAAGGASSVVLGLPLNASWP